MMSLFVTMTMIHFIPQLEMERALLEGEHQTEMEELQSDQEKITVLKEEQEMLMQKAVQERETVRRQGR